MLKHFFFLSFLFASAVVADSSISCPQLGGMESTLRVNDNGSYTCDYRNSEGTSKSITYPNINKKTAIAREIAYQVKYNPKIIYLPASEQRLAAMEVILKEKGEDVSRAAAYLAFVDGDQSPQIAEALSSITGQDTGAHAWEFSKESSDHMAGHLDAIAQDLQSNDYSMGGVTPHIDSHTFSERTLPSILSGVLTLDPEYFGSGSRGTQYINSVGEINVNEDLMKAFKPDPTGMNAEAFVKFAKSISSILGISSPEGVFNQMDFMDKQVLGFYVYLVANINAFFFSLLYGIFLLGVAGSTLAYTAKKYQWKISNLFSKIINSGQGYSGNKDNLRMMTAKTVTIAAAFAFFLAPVVKNDVDSSGSMGKAVYKTSTEDSSREYGYSTLAQLTIREDIQFANYMGNLLNDYAMHSYLNLLQFKMGMIEDLLPKFIQETKKEIAEVEASKQVLAAKSDLYNKACKPYFKNGKFNIPEKSNGGESSKIAFVGDALTASIAAKLSAEGINTVTFSSSGMKFENALSSATSAGESDADTVVIMVGYENIKANSFNGSPLESEGWKSEAENTIASLYIAANQEGKKVYCASPYFGKETNGVGKSVSFVDAMRKYCGNVLNIKDIGETNKDHAGRPTAEGLGMITEDIKAKVGVQRANFINGQSCLKLQREILSESKNVSRSSAIVNTKLEDIHGFVSNVTVQKPGKAMARAKYAPTTDPSKVSPFNKNIHGNSHTWYAYNGTWGHWALPQSAESPGWEKVGRISVYGVKGAHGKYEKGTTEYTASGERMSSFKGVNGITAANWHLPLNTLVSVKFQNGKTLIFRTADRGPLVVKKNKYAPFTQVGRSGGDVKAPSNNPHTASDRWFDLSPVAFDAGCAQNDHWVTTKVLSYNANKNNPPKQPGQLPDGSIMIDRSKCGSAAKLPSAPPIVTNGVVTDPGGDGEGYQDEIHFGEGKYKLNIDESPLTTLTDYINMLSGISNTFGWVSAVSVPSSYEFYKYINMFFVGNTVISGDDGGDGFVEKMRSELKGDGNSENSKALADKNLIDSVVGDILIKNSMWFVVPGFSVIQEKVSGLLERFTIKPQSDLSVEPLSGASGVLKTALAGAAGMAIGGTIAGGGDGTSQYIGATIGVLSGVFLAQASTITTLHIAIAVLSMIISIAIMVMIVSSIGVLLLSTVLIIQAIFFFIEVALFFIFSPAIGIIAAFRGKSEEFIMKFLVKLVSIMFLPILIIIPAYLFIPINMIFKGMTSLLANMTITVMEIGGKLLSEGASNQTVVVDAAKGLLARSAVNGLMDIITLFLTIFVAMIMFFKFKSWMKKVIGMKDDIAMTDSAFGEIKSQMKTYIAPI